MGLKVKGETVDEITGAVEAMRALSEKVAVEPTYLVDTCGTGGSGTSKLFNISTAAAFVAAAAGAHVAKHGNRGMTSKSGSADVLEAAGVNLNLTPAQIGRCVRDAGVGFMFAPAHHRALKHASAARKELGTRTIFNLVAPLTNPASAPNQVIGVFAAERMEILAHVLQQLGSRHVMLVHADGLDELSIAGPSEVVELKGGRITRFRIAPADFGIDVAPLDQLVGRFAARQLGTGEPGVERARVLRGPDRCAERGRGNICKRCCHVTRQRRHNGAGRDLGRAREGAARRTRADSP